MFMGSKNFPGSWGCNFVVSVIRIILTNITNGYVQVHGDVNSWPRATHKSHEHWSPTNNDDSTVYVIWFTCIEPYICETKTKAVDLFPDIDEKELPSHLKVDSQFQFRVTILEASGIASEYADIFCQFKYALFYKVMENKYPVPVCKIHLQVILMYWWTYVFLLPASYTDMMRLSLLNLWKMVERAILLDFTMYRM